jgi:cell division transport system ATP-binding protein
MIIFSSVSKSFADQPTAIVDLNLEVNPGDLVIITGPSGAGKTTLMKLLIREYSPSQGSITFENRSLAEYKKSEIPGLRRQIGVVFQDYKLIEDMNAWENIALPLYIAGMKEVEIESRVTDLLNLIGLADKALHFPRQLSGGEAQRVSIARALATGPKVIFADEPTGNLDSEASLKITRLLRKINELGTTLLFATHDELVIKELDKAKIVHLNKQVPEPPKKRENKEEKEDEAGKKVKVKKDKNEAKSKKDHQE